MSSLIAISAQSGTVNANSQDGTPLGTYNDNYVDAFMPVKTNSATTGSASSTPPTQEIENTGEDAAKKFNAHIKEIYYGGSVTKAQTDPSIAYYLDRFRLIKSTNPVTTAAPFIPANLSITVDGISGIVMGNAFTIPEDRLPASLRGDNLKTKVGFVVVGLTHTLQQNQWLTKIRGQMIRLRDSVEYGGTAQIGTTNQNIVSIPTVITQKVNLQSLNLNADWVSIAFVFIASKEGFLSRPKFDYTKKRAGYGSDNFVTANGEVLDITDNTVFTLADAERTLRYNIQGPYKDAVIRQIGQTQWERLNNRQKASIISYVYNAGPGALKTWGIARAIQTNSSAEQIAVLISRGPITAKNINTGVRTELSALVTRRREEAQLFIS
jgi:GH24 family phage-related lysozyme (muramidase)